MPPLWGWSPRRAECFFGHLIHIEKKQLDLELQQTERPGAPSHGAVGASDNQQSPVSTDILATLVLETNHRCHPHGDLSHPTLSSPSPD